MKVYGGFAGNEPGNATGLAARKPGHNNDAHNPTILSGDLNGDDTANFGNRSDNVYHVVLANDGYCPPECEDCVFDCPYQETNDLTLLDGFIIRGGSATGTGGDSLYEGLSDTLGGGFLCLQGSPVIQNCIFVDNEAGAVIGGNEVGGGGGAHLTGTGGNNGADLLKFIDCSFLGNYSKNVAGGLCNSRDTSVLINCVFVANEADSAGGAIFNPGIGGEIASNQIDLYNCTFTANESPFGSAIDCESGVNPLWPVLNMRNCIVWGNTGAGDQIEYNTSNTTIDIDYCDLEEAITGGGHNLSSDPLFEDVNGNDNVLGTTDDNVRIAGTSPARNSGLNSAVPEDQYDVDNDGSTTGGGGEKTPDRDRAVRVLNTTVDMGAYESHEGTTCCGDINNTGCINVDDLLFIINNWGDSGVGDIAPACSGDGFILVDDLLAVINAWGNCPGFSCNENAMPMSVGDCMEDADELYTTFSAEWDAFVADCVDALCKAEIIECDE